jgi:two-component system, sensor histidine kinase
LTLVRNLVSQHGGHITATSDGPGRGSTFTIELPLVSAPAVPAERSAMPVDRSALKSV